MAQWHKVSQLGDPPSGLVKVVEVAGKRLALCNVDGDYRAIADVCTHDGGSLDQGSLDGCEIECPRHGARFDVRTGKALCLPAIRPIKTYLTKIEGGDIFIEA